MESFFFRGNSISIEGLFPFVFFLYTERRIDTLLGFSAHRANRSIAFQSQINLSKITLQTMRFVFFVFTFRSQHLLVYLFVRELVGLAWGALSIAFGSVVCPYIWNDSSLPLLCMSLLMAECPPLGALVAVRFFCFSMRF